MKYKRLMRCMTIAVLFIGCSQNNDPKSKTLSTENVLEELRDLENLSVFDSDSESTETIAFKETARFGEIYSVIPAPTRGFGPKLAVDETEKVYLVDEGQKTINVYNSDEVNPIKIGREGRGPGEFLRINATHILNDKLYVYDSNLVRLSIFSIKDYSLLKILKFDTQFFSGLTEVRIQIPATVIPFTEELLLIALFLDSDVRSYGYYIINTEGELQSPEMMIKQKSKEMHNGRLKSGGLAGISLPFSEQGLIAVSNASVYHANSKEILIKKYNSNFNYERAFYYAFNKDPLEEQEVLDRFHPNIHSVVKSADYPETWPALDNLLVDDEGRIWVSKIIDDKSKHDWYVLEKNGALKAQFDWPADEPIKLITGGKIYSEKEDQEIGAKVIVAYNFSFEGL